MSGSSRPIAVTVALCLAFVLSIAPPALAASWVVNPTGIGDDFPTIQAAIASSSVLPGDTILLKNGTYTGPGNRDIDFMGKDVVVRSLNMNPLNCIIDCQGSPSSPHRGFLLHQGETSAAWIQAIKIVNGYSNYSPGAGIYIDGASPIIDNCIVQNCIAEGSDGGGVHCGGTASPVIQNSQIRNNGCGGIPAGHGAGIHAGAGATPAIYGCTVAGNNAVSMQQFSAAGGGIFTSGGNIDFCIVSNNHADGPGGGIHATGMQIAYSDIDSNSTTYGNGGGVFLSNGLMYFTNLRGNFGVGGGGLFAIGSSIGKCTITGNTSPGDGGGGIYASGTSFQDCTISGNKGLAGGGVSATSTTFDRSIIWGNCAIVQADEIDASSTVTLICCCVNAAGVNGSVFYQGTQVFSNPMFCAPLSCNSAPTTGGNYTLTSASPCLPGNSPCGNLIGSLPQGCLAADVAELGFATISLELPGVSQGDMEIAWSLGRQDRARLAVFDIQGRRVASLVDEMEAAAGEHRTRWSGRDDRDIPLARGVYFVRLETSRETVTRRTVLLGD